MDNFFVTGLISWFLPGVGHIKNGAWRRGLIIAVVIWGMFIIGMFSGGAYYPGYGLQEGFLLYLLNIFAKFGNGLGFIISWFLSQNHSNNAAAWATFEYGGRFLEVAGLLNYLAAMDAVDISLGEKRMIHFLYLLGFAFFTAIAFGVFSSGTVKTKTLYGVKIFAQFVVISLVLAWIFYFVPWK